MGNIKIFILWYVYAESVYERMMGSISEDFAPYFTHYIKSLKTGCTGQCCLIHEVLIILCQVCNDLEEEYHFICECSGYNEICSSYIPAYYRNRPCMYKIIEFINSSDTNALHNLSKFVFKAFKLYVRTIVK